MVSKPCYSSGVRVRTPVCHCFKARGGSPYGEQNYLIVFRAYMALKLFVGGLPYRTTGDELRDAFAQAGEVATASIVTDRETGRSRGFGFVEMANDADAQGAIAMWNGKDFGGRMLTVSEARPKAA